MAGPAPFCNVKIAQVPGNPSSPRGLQTVPVTATLQQVIHIVNNNFQRLMGPGGNFSEERGARQTVITRIFDPTDHSVFVDVRQITGVLFANPLTGQTISWQR